MSSRIKKIIKVISLVLLIFAVCIVALAYLRYHDLKKFLITKIADEATAFIGQKVEIGDLSIGSASDINIYDISVKNPKKGFISGELLRIRKLHLKMKYRDLPAGKFYFQNITVYSPELTLKKDTYGRLNISDKLRLFLSRKPTFAYRIDEFILESGLFDFNNDERYRADSINITLRNLSSNLGTKTLINGSLSYAKKNTIKVDGWAYLKDDPKKFGISLLSDDLNLSLFSEYFSKYKVNIQKSKIKMNLHAEGDTIRGIRLKLEVQARKTGFPFLRRDFKKIILNMDAFLNIQDDTVVIKDILVYTGDIAALRVKGIITDIQKNPYYKGELELDRTDLSAFNFVRGFDVRGLLTSDSLSIRGTFRKTMPELSGAIQLKDGAVTSNGIDMKTISARVVFLKGKSIKAKATGELFRVGEYTLDKPADIRLSLSTHGKYKKINFLSSANIQPCSIYKRKEKSAYINGGSITISGTLKDRTFTVKSSFVTEGIQYADYTIPRLKGRTGIDYRKNLITLKDFDVSTEDIHSSVSQMRIETGKNIHGYALEVKSVNISYQKKKAKIRDVDLYVNLQTGKDYLSGDFNFSSGHAIVEDIKTDLVSWSGFFNKKDFLLDIPRANIGGGRIKLSLEGKTSGGPFPIKINGTANNIGLDSLSKAIPKISDMPYRISGDITSAAFNGTMNSMNSLCGNAEVKTGKISISKKDSKRHILKDFYIDSKIQFAGEDLEIKADAIANKISTNITGEVKKFKGEDRSIEIKVALPEVKATDIRDAFWDIFPDNLLYTGLNGSISSDAFILYNSSGIKIDGALVIKDLILEGENNEYSVGPINGVIPIAYAKSETGQEPVNMSSFERSAFDTLNLYYSQNPLGRGFSRITIKSFRYGFQLMKDMDIQVKQKGTILNIGSFSGTIFGGRFHGSAIIDFSSGFHYRAGMLIKGLSLAELCEDIEPIKGYISGKVDGIANIKGSGTGISQIIGEADFWTYSTDNEKTKISREFLQKIGGPALKTYLGERRFDKGIMSVYIQNGFLIFKELEISNRNILGIKDLSIKVMPFNNRIAIDHLMWTITEAAQRAKEK